MRNNEYSSQQSINLRRFGLESTERPSLAFYNTYEEIDRLTCTVKRIQMGQVI